MIGTPSVAGRFLVDAPSLTVAADRIVPQAPVCICGLHRMVVIQSALFYELLVASWRAVVHLLLEVMEHWRPLHFARLPDPLLCGVD